MLCQFQSSVSKEKNDFIINGRRRRKRRRKIAKFILLLEREEGLFFSFLFPFDSQNVGSTIPVRLFSFFLLVCIFLSLRLSLLDRQAGWLYLTLPYLCDVYSHRVGGKREKGKEGGRRRSNVYEFNLINQSI
jgi:hypothetical protein